MFLFYSPHKSDILTTIAGKVKGDEAIRPTASEPGSLASINITLFINQLFINFLNLIVMNKKFLSMAAAAMMFAACSDDLKVDQVAPEIAQNPTEATAEQVPVLFGAYVNRATTRAGLTSTLEVGDLGTDADNDGTNDTQDGLSASGFGVFGYYTNSDLYVADAYQPNFMYNQRVYNTSTTQGTLTWEYSPVKYWPNEFGAGAVSDEIDRVSFFAYAPYVSVTASTGVVKNNSASSVIASSLSDTQYYTEDNGDATTGIIGLSRNTAMSDPYVKYVASLDPTSCVDLCYGVAGATVSREGLTDLTAGSNFIDVTKPDTESKLTFDFKHALAQLNVQIDAAVDALDPGTPLGTETRIYVRSIEFEGLTDKGMLNLRDHGWYDITTGQAGLDGTLVLYDGRSDGREAVMAAVNEKNAYLNTDLVQTDAYTQPGVTQDAVNLFANAAALTTPIYVIPTGQELRVTIVYDVETQDENLPGYLSGSTTHGSSVQNAITQTVSSGFKLSAGYSYTLKLHLGMNSVKFDVNEITDWLTGSTAETSLPANISGTLAQWKTQIAAADATTLASYSALLVGKFVNADGSISSATTSTTVGKIAYITNTANDIDTNTELASANILVLGNEDLTYAYNSSTSGYWASATGWLSGTDVDQWWITGANYTNFLTADNSVYNAQTEVTARSGQLNGYDISTAFGSTATNYAIYTAYNYDLTSVDGIDTAGYGIEGTSLTGAIGHWFLPTVEQMIKMGASVYRYDGTNASNASYPATGVMSTLSGVYWSSSECSAAGAWFYNATYGYWSDNRKAAYSRKVRPVFAY